MKRTEKKRKQKKAVLICTLATAAVIVGGMTFAWFSSQDEVTNRLSARADYSVSISEDFTPPENWIPGQEIEKNVYVTNTGNVDAFARVWLEGEFNIVKEGDGIAATDTYTISEITDNDKMKALGFEETGGHKYVKRLSKTSTQNDHNKNEASSEYVAGNSGNSGSGDVVALSEVQALQAGGYLAYAPANAQYEYTLNENNTVLVYYDATNDAQEKNIPQGSVIKVGATKAEPASGVYTAPTNRSGAIDSDTFKPATTGLYLFRRNMDVNNGASDQNWEYSGYYYVQDSTDPTAGVGKYYALKTKTTTAGDATVYADGVVTANIDVQTGAISNASGVKILTAEQFTRLDDNIVWKYTDATGTAPAKLTATLTDGSEGNASTKIAVDVALANLGTAKDNWTRVAGNGALGAVGTATRDTFYYTNDIEEGATTAKLVDSVTLAPETKQTAYIAFDFDLNVKMDSIQVIPDADGNEGYASVKDGWATTNTKAVAQKATATVGNPEIDTITWTN